MGSTIAVRPKENLGEARWQIVDDDRFCRHWSSASHGRHRHRPTRFARTDRSASLYACGARPLGKLTIGIEKIQERERNVLGMPG